MPIILNDAAGSVTNDALAKSAAMLAKKKLQDPKFFSKDLTGTGKSTGLLCVSMNPANLPMHVKGFTRAQWDTNVKINTFTKVKSLPIHPLGAYNREREFKATGSMDPHFVWIGDSTLYPGAPVYINLEPQTVHVMDYLGVKASNSIPGTAAAPAKEHKIDYRCELIVPNSGGANATYVVQDTQFMFNPIVDLPNWLSGFGVNVDKAKLDAYLQNYITYDEVCRLSERWQAHIAEIIIEELDAFVANPHSVGTFPIKHMLQYITKFKISLDQYKILYDELNKRYNPDEIREFTRINTSLLLHQTVEALSNTQFDPFPTTASTMPLNFYSKEQRDAITSTSPLNIIQAGAGTGKSTTVNARLNYLKSVGVNLADVMVLSFTNAAADHITEICPGVQSMTIAKMLDTIYKTAHPSHQLSSSDVKSSEGATFQNSLELYRKNNPIAEELIQAANANAKYNDYAKLLTLCENHHDEVMQLLDQIGQTTFAIELVICYLDYANLNIPFSIKHLIIDEVQDNAEFEFIFFLNMTSMVRNHLYLVGDSSQTLFEFRASNPKAINAIEASGIFQTFPLSTNYRSNQCILEFANVLLQSIEANAIAKLQLQAFSLQPITQQDFMHHVTLDYTKIDKQSEVMPLIEKKFKNGVKAWIDSKLANNEQVCILTHYGRDVRTIEKMCRNLWQNKTIVNISPEKNWSFGYFSRYISNNPQRLLSLPTQSIDALMNRLCADVIADVQNSGKLNPNANNYNVIMNKVRQYVSEWQAQEWRTVEVMLLQFQQGKMSHTDFCNAVGQSLIDFEIAKNGLAQTLSSAKNAKKKVDTKNADILLCTIHSAKGLEFDNTVVIYKNDNSISQEDMRMYYVALTRAKNAEYVIAHGTVINSLIGKYYDAALTSLPAGTAPAAGTPGGPTDPAAPDDSAPLLDAPADDTNVPFEKTVTSADIKS